MTTPMKRSAFLIICLITMLLSSTTANADTYHGTMERWGYKMKYTISGGEVTKKNKPYIYGPLHQNMAVLTEGKVQAGGTLEVSCAKVVGPTGTEIQKQNKEIEIEYTIYDANGKSIDSKKVHKNSSSSLSVKVPQNAKKVHIDFSCNTVRTKFEVQSEWKVVKETTSANSSSGESYNGTLEHGNTKVKYTVSGFDRMISGGGGKSSQNLMLSAHAGCKINLSANTVSGDNGKLRYSITAEDENGREITKKEEKNKSTASLSYTIPSNAKRVSIGLDHNYMPSLSITIGVGAGNSSSSTKQTTTTASKTFNWDDVSPDDVCATCKRQYSGYWFINGGNSPTYFGSVAQTIRTSQGILFGCKRLGKKLLGSPNINTPIYIDDYIVTDNNSWADIANESDTVRICENTRVLYEGVISGRHRFTVAKGAIIGKGLKKKEKKPWFSLSNVFADILGTVYVIQDDGKTSRVYLLAGKIELTSKKNNKKLTMQAGQVVTAGSDGNMKVQKFDVQKVAQKYNIRQSDVKSHSSSSSSNSSKNSSSSSSNTQNNNSSSNSKSSTTTSTQKRYTQKTGTVKYKITKGNQQGELLRQFDLYGAYERRVTTMKNPAKKTFVLVRGTTTYTLNTQEKTAKASKNIELNFMDMDTPAMQKLNLKKEGTANVLGKTCTVYASGSSKYYVWNGIVLKKTSTSNGTTTTIEATSIQLNTKFNTDIFKVPNGYTVK